MQNNIILSTLQVTGPDSVAFLQGQLTCDVTEIREVPSFGAYCDPRGRVIANFKIQKIDDAFYIVLPESMIDLLWQRLKKFVLFSKVTLAKQARSLHHSIENDKLTLIKQGIAFIYPETSGLFTPQMINWEKHGGVSFTKGCYVGQEVVARTQHLGKLKRHLHTFIFEGDSASVLLFPGADLMNAEQQPVGIICDSAFEGHALYVLAVVQDAVISLALKETK